MLVLLAGCVYALAQDDPKILETRGGSLEDFRVAVQLGRIDHGSALGLAESFWGLVLVHTIYGLAFTTLFFRNYYVAVPDELVKAARIDGASRWQMLIHITLPLLKAHMLK